jgi:hypothetical protein
MEREARLNPLQSLANVGQTGTARLGEATQQYGANIGNIAMANAGNQANALLTQGNIRASQYGTAGRGLEEALDAGAGKYLESFMPTFGYSGQ